MKEERLSIDRREVLRYLGYRKGQPLGGVLPLLEEAEQLFQQLSQPRFVTGTFDLQKTPAGISLVGTTLVLPGVDIAAHLSQCQRGILLAATLGLEIERKITQLQHTQLALSLVLDACATAGIEALCDQVESQLREERAQAGENITSRFSPGYGDLPIELQPAFLEALGAPRRIGLQSSASYLLSPRKSVTAVMGILPAGVNPSVRSCANCARFTNCPYRKDGKTCGF